MSNMIMVPPDAPPRVALARDDGYRRLRVRSCQVSVSALTIVGTAWCFTLGWGPGIVATMFAKHILVAILVWGLGVDERREDAQDILLQ
jgi:hypothetical protein